MLACWFGVDRSTITRAIGEVRPLLAQWGCTVAPGIRLRTLAEVIEHLGVQALDVLDGRSYTAGLESASSMSSRPCSAIWRRHPSWACVDRLRSGFWAPCRRLVAVAVCQ
ncbi:hypothetical protein [Streptomyces umbrinus]|uniref:hypothetical protein n=1 Tax=Streptomyces umbrinus TaxID=67370 RepID=UPI0027D90A61|nr:hypothetical protein [Streptomyces umbrinus]